MSDEKMTAEEVERFKATIADLSIWSEALDRAAFEARNIRSDLMIAAFDMPRDAAFDKIASLPERMAKLRDRVREVIK